MKSENNTSPDKILASGLKKGDRIAFQKLFEKYYKHLLGTSMTIVKDIETAKDIIQDVFLTIWNNRKNIDPHNNIGGYLKRTTINKSLNKIRSKKIVENVTILEMHQSKEADPNAQLQSKDLSNIINKALMELPERCRLIFTLKRIEGMTLKEIAQELNISPKTVENQMTKALKALKTAVIPYLNK